MATQVRPTRLQTQKCRSEFKNASESLPARVRVGGVCAEVVVLIADQQESCDLAFKIFAGVDARQRVEVDLSLDQRVLDPGDGQQRRPLVETVCGIPLG